jgi:hypothetical protein
MTNRAETAVVIVNWNGRRFLDDCLRTLAAQTYRQFHLYFVDNGSEDDSVAFIEREYPGTRIICNQTNEGFVGGNNRGIAAALEDSAIRYIALLNNDTEVAPDWLASLISEMERQPKAGIVASKIRIFAARELIDSAGDVIERASLRVVNRGRRELDKGQFDEPVEVFSACAAACLLRRETLEDVCLDGEYFDRDFGSYIEDVDLCIRARLRGWECRYAPRAQVYHVGSGTSMTLHAAWKYRISTRNRLLMAFKDLPVRHALRTLLRYLFPMDDAKHLLARRLPHMPSSWAPRVESNHFGLLTIATIHLGGVMDAIPLIPRMLDKRRVIQRRRVVTDAEIDRWFTELSQ